MNLDLLEQLYIKATDKALALAFLTKDGEVLHINSLFTEVTKIVPQDILNKNIQDIFKNFPLEQVVQKDDCFTLKNNSELNLNYCFYTIDENFCCLKVNDVFVGEAHQKVEIALSSLDSAVWDWNMKTNEAWFDKNWPKMLGYDTEKLTKDIEAWTEFAHPDDQEKTIAEMSYHIKHKTPSALCIQRFKHKSGRWVRIMTNGKVIERDENDKPLRFIGINTNISNIKNFEEFSSEIQSLSDTGTWEVDLNSGVKTWSKKTFEIYGLDYSQTPPTNDEIMNHYELSSARLAIDSTRKLIEKGTEYDIDLKLQSGKWIRLVGRSESSNNEVYKIYGIIQDIDERKKAEEELLKSQETLQLALKAGEFGVWEWDLSNQNIYCSPSMRVLFSEVDSHDFHFEDLMEIVHEDDRTKIIEELTLLREVTDKFDFSYRIRKLNNWRWVRTIANVRKDKDGKEQVVISITWDITKEIEIQQKQKQIIEQAEHNSEMKSRFMATVSHEIRTPMSGIIGMTELLSESDLNAEQRETVQTVKICAENLLTLVNDILDYSKLEANKLELDKRPFKLIDTIKNTIDLFAYKARQKGIEIKYEIDPEITEYIVQDEARLYQVLFNLIGNAVKFTLKGEVKVTVKKRGTHLVFSVKDTGIGISKSQQGLIFESFTQLAPGLRTDSHGTGLGLSISKSIVELMGGEIQVESEEDQGSTFIFDIEASNKPHTIPNIAVTTSKTKSKDLHHMKILVVEDNPINLKLISAILEKIGVQIDSAEDGLVAVEKVKKHDYHLVFMDVQMPRLDGKKATQRIRSLEGKADKPYIVALTANVTPEHKQECLDSGMDDFLSKPIRVQIIRSLIESYASQFNLVESTQEEIIAPGHLKLIDTNRLEIDFEGFDDLLVQFIDIFLKNYSTYLQQLETFIAEENFEETSKVAHTFKGIISNFQSVEIRHNIEELERLAKSKDINGLKACFNKTTSLVSKLVIEINELSSKLTK